MKVQSLKQFEKNRATCKTCNKIIKARATLRKLDNDNNQVEEEKEAVSIEDSAIERIQSILKDKSDVKFQTREEAEEFIANDLMNDISTLNALADLYEDLANEAGSKKDKKEYAAKLETVTQKKIDLKLKLIKSFDFFSELSKPENDDPLYTPVHIYLNENIPSESIVESKFHAKSDEIQDLENEPKQ